MSSRIPLRFRPACLTHGHLSCQAKTIVLRTAAVGVPIRPRLRRPLNLGWLIFWDVFPGIISFAVPAIVRIWWYATGVTPASPTRRQRPAAFPVCLDVVMRQPQPDHIRDCFGMICSLRKRPNSGVLRLALRVLIVVPGHQGMFALHFAGRCLPSAFLVFVGRTLPFLIANYGAKAPAYSYLSASIGFSRDAFRAGKNPDTIPTRARMMNETIITPIDACRKIAPS